jgi:hypothetical protein
VAVNGAAAFAEFCLARERQLTPVPAPPPSPSPSRHRPESPSLPATAAQGNADHPSATDPGLLRIAAECVAGSSTSSGTSMAAQVKGQAAAAGDGNEQTEPAGKQKQQPPSQLLPPGGAPDPGPGPEAAVLAVSGMTAIAALEVRAHEAGGLRCFTSQCFLALSEKGGRSIAHVQLKRRPCTHVCDWCACAVICWSSGW